MATNWFVCLTLDVSTNYHFNYQPPDVGWECQNMAMKYNTFNWDK